MNKTKILLLSISSAIAILIIIAGGTIWYFKHHNQPPKAKIIVAKPITRLSTSGEQTASESYTISYNPQLGHIHKILVKDNSTITANTPILEYINPIIEQQIQTQMPILSSLEKQFKQSPKDPILPTLISQFQLQLFTNKSHIYTKIYSPINGNISIINSNPSKLNEKIIQINSNQRIIRANISEVDLNLLQSNQILTVIPYNKKNFTGKITNISKLPNKVKKDKSYYQITISTKQDYPIGTHFKIELTSDTIELPKSAVVDDKYVYIAYNKKFIKREIKYTKSSKKGYIHVTQGISIGEYIVVNPNETRVKPF